MARHPEVAGEQATGQLDLGYFPEGASVLREVHSHHIVGLLYGQRALLIGALDPRNYVGTSDHTKGKSAPFERLARTAKIFETVFFDTKAEAEAKLASVRKLHERHVHGELSEDAGPYKAGTPYSAMDPELMLWTVASIADSAEAIHQNFVAGLSKNKKERLWQDYRLFGELFGLPKDKTPDTYKDFREYFDGRFHNKELHLTESARYMGKLVCFHAPLPHDTITRPAQEAQNLFLLGTLPHNVREMYGLGWGIHQELAFQAIALNSRLAHQIVPAKFQHRGKNDLPFNEVIKEERRRRQAGTAPSMPANAYRRAA